MLNNFYNLQRYNFFLNYELQITSFFDRNYELFYFHKLPEVTRKIIRTIRG